MSESRVNNANKNVMEDKYPLQKTNDDTERTYREFDNEIEQKKLSDLYRLYQPSQDLTSKSETKKVAEISVAADDFDINEEDLVLSPYWKPRKA